MKDKFAYSEAENDIDKIARKNKGRDIGGGTDMRTGLREQQYYFRSQGDAVRFMKMVKKLGVTKGYRASYADSGSEWPYKKQTIRLNPNESFSDEQIERSYKILTRYGRLRRLLKKYDVLELFPAGVRIKLIRKDPETMRLLPQLDEFMQANNYNRRLIVDRVQGALDAYVDGLEQELERDARNDARAYREVERRG
jgi:hypothetical protein